MSVEGRIEGAVRAMGQTGSLHPSSERRDLSNRDRHARYRELIQEHSDRSRYRGSGSFQWCESTGGSVWMESVKTTSGRLFLRFDQFERILPAEPEFLDRPGVDQSAGDSGGLRGRPAQLSCDGCLAHSPASVLQASSHSFLIGQGGPDFSACWFTIIRSTSTDTGRAPDPVPIDRDNECRYRERQQDRHGSRPLDQPPRPAARWPRQ